MSPAHMCPKPKKGTARKATRARRAAIERAEATAKQAAKKRDGWCCRRCGYGYARLGQSPWLYHYGGPPTLEAAHLIDKGMGGDHGRHSSHPRDYVTLCHDCHQGPRGVHAGFVVMRPLTDRGGDGPVEFVNCDPRRGKIGGAVKALVTPELPLSTRRG